LRLHLSHLLLLSRLQHLPLLLLLLSRLQHLPPLLLLSRLHHPPGLQLLLQPQVLVVLRCWRWCCCLQVARGAWC
jgi:hypothetical protein